MLLNIEISNWFWLIISILATWRLTCLICFDSGPFDLMSRIRLALYRVRLGKLVECFHCTALWISSTLTILIYKLSIASLFLIIAIAGGATLIERWLSHDLPFQDEKNESL